MDDSSTISDFAPPMRGMELVARSSIHSLRPPSITSTSSSNCSEAHIWKLTDLRVGIRTKQIIRYGVIMTFDRLYFSETIQKQKFGDAVPSLSTAAHARRS
jgi:hypothetical protein